MKITKRSIEALPIKEKDSFLWDDTLAGFGVKITPTGKRSYIYQYRLGGRRGRTRRLSLGVHGHITTEQARREATKIAGQVAAGKDVANERRDRNKAPKVSDVMDIFFKDHVTKLKPSTQYSYKCLAKVHIRPQLGNLKIDDLNRNDITKLHHSLCETPYHANRTLAVMRKMMSWAEEQGYRKHGSNPCIGIKKFREKARERFLSESELHTFAEALTKLSTDGRITHYIAGAIRLLLLTGCRLREILDLKWSEVDCDRGWLNLEDTKTGRRSIHLNKDAIQLIQSIPQIEVNPYVFCGRLTDKPIVNTAKPWKRICEEAGLSGVRIHDLRHTHASIAAIQGYSLPMIGALLGHTQAQTTARYSHLASDPIRQASEDVGTYITNAMQNPQLRVVGT